MCGVAAVGMLLPMTFQSYGPPYGVQRFAPPPDPVRVPPLPYHRQALVAGRHAWWRPLVGTLLVMSWGIVLMVALFVGSDVAGAVLDRPLAADDVRSWGDIGDMAIDLLSIAVLIPPVLLAARWVQGRPGGTVSSVTGRLRWRWLGMCLLLALPPVLGTLGLSFLLPAPEGGREDVWVGLPTFLSGLLVVGAIVPFQAAAEEYVFRGWLLQAVGVWARSPWIVVLPQSVLFGAAHGWGTVWGFVDLVVFGVVTGLLAIRTGGIEAGIALHVLNNLLALGIAAALEDGLASDETAADMDWLTAAVDIPMVLLFGFVVLRVARRHGVATESAPRDLAYPYGYTPHAPGAWGGAPGPAAPGSAPYGANPCVPHQEAAGPGGAAGAGARPGASGSPQHPPAPAPSPASPSSGQVPPPGSPDPAPTRGWVPPSGRVSGDPGHGSPDGS